jgi:hypothetical protein
MKRLLLLAYFISLPLSAQVSCVDLGQEEVEAIYCELKQSEDFEGELKALQSNCEKETDIYRKVSNEIGEKAKSFRPTSKEAFQLQMLSLEYSTKASKAVRVQTQLTTLSIQDMTAKWRGEEICN